MTNREAMKMALEKSEWGFMEDAENILRQALARPEQELVGFYVYKPVLPRGIININAENLPWVYDQDPSSGYLARMFVYTAPPRKEWVGLADDVVAMIEKTVVTRKQAIRMIEHHLKELNT